MKKVAMFVTNPCTHDARVMKEAQTLAENNYDVRIFALGNDRNPEGIYQVGGYAVQRLQFDNIFKRTNNLIFKAFKTIAKIILVPILLFISICRKFYAVITKKKYTSSSAEIFQKSQEFSFRKFRVITYLHLRKSLRYSHRRRVLKTLGFINQSLRFVIKKTKRALYFILLPAHKISTFYFFCQKAKNLALDWGVDIAHCHDLNTLYAGKAIKQSKSNATVIYDSHELWIHRNRVGRKATVEKIIDKYAEKHLIPYADKIITVCESIGDWLQQAYTDIPEPVILRNMPHLIEQSEAQEKNLKQRLNIPEDKIAIIYTGKITTGRGINIGIDLLAKVPNMHFVLLGYGDAYLLEVQQRIKDLKISDRVTFCDPIPYSDVSNFIKGADLALVYIEPICLSYEYALPNKLFESIQAGIPILGSNLVEIKKVVDTHDVGLCFENEEDLVNKINNLEPEKIQSWRENIANHRDSLCWETESKKLVSLYDSIA